MGAMERRNTTGSRHHVGGSGSDAANMAKSYKATPSPEPLELRCLAARTAAGQARTLIGYRLADWGLGGRRFAEMRSDIFLVAAELIANAVEKTPDNEISITLIAEEGAVLVGVWDSSNDRPVSKPVAELELDNLDLDPAHFDDNGGWGLPLVMALATETGISPTPPRGKWVWARFKLP